MLSRIHQSAPGSAGAIVPLHKPVIVTSKGVRRR
jgi:hypothetical protein